MRKLYYLNCFQCAETCLIERRWPILVTVLWESERVFALCCCWGNKPCGHRSGWWRSRVSQSLVHVCKSNLGTLSQLPRQLHLHFDPFDLTYFEALLLGACAFRVLMNLRVRSSWCSTGHARTKLCIWPAPFEQGGRVMPATPAFGSWAQTRPYSYVQTELEARLATWDPSQK